MIIGTARCTVLLIVAASLTATLQQPTISIPQEPASMPGNINDPQPIQKQQVVGQITQVVIASVGLLVTLATAVVFFRHKRIRGLINFAKFKTAEIQSS